MSSMTRRRWAPLARSAARSSRATGAGRNTSPHSTSIAVRPRYGASAVAAARTSSSNSATSTRRFGPAPSTRRATAWPTSPLPPRMTTVRSRRSMQSLDLADLVRGERAVPALWELPQAHGAVGNAVQPLHLQPQLLGEAPHDALPPLGERHLHLDASTGRSHPARHDAHGAVVDDDAAGEGALHRLRLQPVRAKPVGAGHGETGVHEPVRGRPVRRQQQQARRHHVQASNVREAGHLGEEVEDRGPALGVPAAYHVPERLVEPQPGPAGRANSAAVHGDALALRIDRLAQNSDRAVHLHAAGADQLLGLAPGGHARARQGALQAHQRHSCSSAGAGGRTATDSSSSRGSSSSPFKPRISRNCGVVPYSSGRPSPSPREATSTRPRSSSFSITASESTPRISSTSRRPTGWRYAMMARGSRAAGDSRRGRNANWARSSASAYSGRVRNCHPSPISASSTPWSAAAHAARNSFSAARVPTSPASASRVASSSSVSGRLAANSAASSSCASGLTADHHGGERLGLMQPAAAALGKLEQRNERRQHLHHSGSGADDVDPPEFLPLREQRRDPGGRPL